MRFRHLTVALLVMSLAGCHLFEGEAEQRVREALKDPGSATFKDVRTYKYEWLGKKRWMTCGSVNAKNSFGALAGFRSFIVQDTASGAFVSDSAAEDLNATLCCLAFGVASRATGSPANEPKVYEACKPLQPEFAVLP